MFGHSALPRAARDAWTVSVPASGQRILSWAATDTGQAVASTGYWSVSDAGGWTHLPWQEIQHGGWDAVEGVLRWTDRAGRRGTVRIERPGRLPDAFRERVKASIVFERVIPVGTESAAGVVVSARRDLTGSSDALVWHVDLQRGLTWRTPGLRERADAALAACKAEFDPAS